MDDYNDLHPFDYLHPKLKPYVRAVLTHEFGLLGDLARIENSLPGSIVAKTEPTPCDRFQLRISYCNKPLFWQVLMNPYNLSEPPDFIMEENFLADYDSNFMKMNVPSLANWCPTDVKCLLNVVLELLNLYKENQVEILRKNQNMYYRCAFEYDTLMSMIGISPSDIEVCIQNPTRGFPVLFFIHLNVDFSKLPIPLPDNKNLTILAIEFKDTGKNVVQLLQREELENVLGGQIELLDLHSGASLIDYIPNMQSMLQKKINNMVNGITQRSILYSYLIQYFESAVLNGDTVMFQQVAFLLELDGFYSILKIEIPLTFPEDQPKITLLSLHKAKNGNPRSEDFSNLRYNPKSTIHDIAKNLFFFVRRVALIRFKDHIQN